MLYRIITPMKTPGNYNQTLIRINNGGDDRQVALNLGKCEVLRVTNSCHLFHTWSAAADDTNGLTTQQRSFKETILHALRKSRPHVTNPLFDNASAVWDPSTKSTMSKVEAVQRRAACFVTGDYRRTSSVTTMLQHLG